jgi:hypothetical protein
VGKLTNVVALAGGRSHVLVAEEGDQVDLVALVLAGLAVHAGGGGHDGRVAVEVVGAALLLLRPGLHLELLEDGHGLGRNPAEEGGGGEGGELHF